MTPMDIGVRTHRALIELGCPCSLCGYRALLEAIELVYHEPDYASGITTMLYPEIGKRLNTTGPRAERSMRHAIERIFEYGNTQAIYDYFGSGVARPDKGKLTNKEFICGLVEYFNMEDRRYG